MALAGDFERFAYGCARDVYLNDDQTVVYKLEYERGANAYEIETLNRLSNISLPADFGIPAFSSYRVDDHDIIAMEFVDGRKVGACLCAEVGLDCDCEPETLISKIVESFLLDNGITDIGYGNLIERNGITYLIDAD